MDVSQVTDSEALISYKALIVKVIMFIGCSMCQRLPNSGKFQWSLSKVSYKNIIKQKSGHTNIVNMWYKTIIGLPACCVCQAEKQKENRYDNNKMTETRQR